MQFLFINSNLYQRFFEWLLSVNYETTKVVYFSFLNIFKCLLNITCFLLQVFVFSFICSLSILYIDDCLPPNNKFNNRLKSIPVIFTGICRRPATQSNGTNRRRLELVTRYQQYVSIWLIFISF